MTYINIYTDIHTHNILLRTDTNTHIHIYKHTCINMFESTSMHKCTDMHAQTNTEIQININSNADTDKKNAQTHTYAYMHMCIGKVR